MPVYEIAFRPRPARSFECPSTADQRQLSKQLQHRCLAPGVPVDTVRDIPDGYKIEPISSGTRAINQVKDGQLLILALAIGSWAREKSYEDANREFLNVDD